jgi:hypothetical protein
MSTDSSVSSPETPKKPSAIWKWLRRVGCMFVLMACTCCGLMCVGGRWVLRQPYTLHKEEVDRFHADGMKGGDVKAMFDRADPKFRKRFTLEELQKFLDERPGILERENLNGTTFSKKKIGDVDFVKVKSMPSYFSMDQWEIVFKIVDGVLVLVGISPGMDEDVPEAFRYRMPSGRRHRWWD